tara:strand:- start:95 stop:304 length:210 start_codon:yes stop_codon:yes gene_type:complete
MAKESDIKTTPALLTLAEYNALMPPLKEEYDKVYGSGEKRQHHLDGYTQAKIALNPGGSRALREKLRKS